MGQTVPNFQPQHIQRPAKLAGQVEAQLRDAILKSVFGPGEFLPSESKLMKIFGVSRNVIREALLMLAAKGLIEIKKGRGAFIIEPSIDNVLDPFSQLVAYQCGMNELGPIHSIRQIIEPSLAALAAKNRTRKDLLKLKDNINEMELSQNDKNMVSHYDIVFHISIAKACLNPLAPIVMEPIFHVLAKFHPPVFYDQEIVDITLEYHRQIYKAIEEQNEIAASQAMSQHLKLAEEHSFRLSDNHSGSDGL